ncbi:unnamed protein product [Prunus armeniaca]
MVASSGYTVHCGFIVVMSLISKRKAMWMAATGVVAGPSGLKVVLATGPRKDMTVCIKRLLSTTGPRGGPEETTGAVAIATVLACGAMPIATGPGGKFTVSAVEGGGWLDTVLLRWPGSIMDCVIPAALILMHLLPTMVVWNASVE